jgi:polar amino acid transport system permease protein
VLIKATPLLFLLSVKDIVYYARELGSTKTSAYAFPHPDWRLYYFFALLAFYLLMTKVSEIVLGKISARLSKGQATAAGEAQRRAAV